MLNERDANRMIAVLVQRLGGKVTVSMMEILERGRSELTIEQSGSADVITLTTTPPPVTIEGEFTVVRSQPGAGRGQRPRISKPQV